MKNCYVRLPVELDRRIDEFCGKENRDRAATLRAAAKTRRPTLDRLPAAEAGGPRRAGRRGLPLLSLPAPARPVTRCRVHRLTLLMLAMPFILLYAGGRTLWERWERRRCGRR